MGKVITITNTKGGVGKSTLTFFLYKYFERLGGKVAIMDTDLQRSLTQINTQFGKQMEIVSSLNGGYDYTFVDTPPYRSEDSDALFRSSAFVLIPVTPSIMDVNSTQTIIQETRRLGVKSACVLNKVKFGTKFTDEIREQLENSGARVFKTEIHERLAFSRDIVLYDIADDKAMNEIKDVANELLMALV